MNAGQLFTLHIAHSREFIGMCDVPLQTFYLNQAGLDLVGLDSMDLLRHTPVETFFFPEDRWRHCPTRSPERCSTPIKSSTSKAEADAETHAGCTEQHACTERTGGLSETCLI